MKTLYNMSLKKTLGAQRVGPGGSASPVAANGRHGGASNPRGDSPEQHEAPVEAMKPRLAGAL